MDGAAPHVYGAGVTVTELWETRSAPADNSGRDEVTDHPPRLLPPKNGSNFRIIEYPPDRLRGSSDQSRHFSTIGAAGAHDRDNQRHFAFHKTATTDYAILLAGEIYAMMDEGEILMKPGDVLIQRGTNHAWSNRTDEPAYIAFVLIDADPV
jgi:hypothetical protein